ncbi:MAG: pilus assembly protein N-terminal domain-containing protein [Acidobacteria bacterium]|nr:pilus assembly protein N-terminal domain-containing protein [Acidobacteriota bacterium]
MTLAASSRTAGITALACLALHAAPGVASARQLAPPAPNVVIRSQYRRLPFTQDIQRLAVADTEILTAELITSREVLVLGRETGRTTLIVWFANGTSTEFPFSVERDLSVLGRALKRVHPSIEVESAPDRDALVLTGAVPDLTASMTAEAIARNYLEAGNNGRGAVQPLLATAPQDPGAAAPGGAAQPAAAAPPAPRSQLQGAIQTSGAVINLLQLDTLPALPEEKIRDAVRAIGGQDVTVRRVLHGDVRDDSADTLVLEGRVPNQTALMRVLVLSAQLFAGQTLADTDIRVVADEAGGLAGQMQTQSTQTQLGGGATSSLFGGARGNRLTNEVRTNLGRAKAIQAAGGRILSFIEVVDLPQVRVDIRLVEVNRTKLRSFNPSSAVVTSDFRQPSLNPAQSATQVQGDQAARVGSGGAAIQNVLSFLTGGLSNELQYSGGHAAIDSALTLLEREGIAQSLSSPSLTVLSGELAQVQIGGEVPVPTAFAPAFGTAAAAGAPGAAQPTPGVFSSVEFVPFGVQLQIRPLVGEDDTITLDVQPLVVTPDAVLTDAIRQSTGAAVATTAFQTRALRTSSRLQDGQALLIGGLLSNSTSTNTASTPGLRGVPILGRLFQGFNRNDQDTELIVVVNPAILRTPVPDVAMWTFPGRDEMLRSVMAGKPRP